MLNTSNNFETELNNDNREFLEECDITFTDKTTLKINNTSFWDNGLTIEDAVSSDTSFDIGSAIINKCTLTLNNIYDDFSEYEFEGAEIIAYVGLRLSDGTIEKLRKGTFAVDETKYNSSLITLSCLDNMRKFDRAYSESALIYPATLNAIIRDACTVCGVTLNTASFPHDDFVIRERPSDEATTFREVISWCAQIAGCFCRCDVYGRLELKWYDQAALENPEENKSAIHKIKSTFSTDVSTDDVVITGVRVVEKNQSEDAQEKLTTYQAGADGYVLSIENNDLIRSGAGQTVAGWLGEQLIGFRFRKASITHLSDPTIEAGDVAILTDRKGVEYKLIVSSTKFSPGNIQSTNSSAETPARNSSKRFSQRTKNYVEWREALQKEKTERERALEELGERLANSPGVFTTVEKPSSGGNVYYLHNKPNLSESDMIWKMTAEAWGVSTDGGKTWNAGMTVDGDTIVRVLAAEGVNANWVNAGEIVVQDSEGNILFSVNMDTKQVIISGDSVRIGNKSATDAIKEALEAAQKAQNLNIILDNEYQGIPTDHEGNCIEFPDVKVMAQVLYGHTDISADCTYSVAKSAGVTGTWNGATRTYTVAALSTDTGWVDITASYLNLFTTTKRFNVAKIKGGKNGEKGETGTAGRTYFIEASTLVLKRSADNSISPNFVEFKAFYRDGNSAARTAYSGRFKIEESTDGETWTTLYTSSINESSISHSVYSALATASGSAIATADGNMIKVARDIVLIRCILYAADGTTNALDTQSVTVVTDVDALTHEEIFNLLTNNGEVKGIYQEGNQLYISFTYAKGGNLTLGGVDGTYGELNVFSSNLKQIIGMGRDGFSNFGESWNDGVGGRCWIKDGVIRLDYKQTTPLEIYTRLNLWGGQLDIRNVNNGDYYFYVNAEGLKVYGIKSRIANTKDYGRKLLYCYEMPSPMFGDIGEAETDENGECYIYLDDIFSETVTANIEYQVFLQKEGLGDIWIAEKNPVYFVVKGTENLKFAWEIKVKQRDYEYERLESAEPEEEQKEIDYEAEYVQEINQVIAEQEDILYDTTA